MAKLKKVSTASAAKKAPISKAKNTPKASSPLAKKVGSVVSAVAKATPLGMAANLLSGGGSTSKRKGVKGGKLSARVLLKRAYDRRAKRHIRMGQLGQARRDLRKKATIIG